MRIRICMRIDVYVRTCRFYVRVCVLVNTCVCVCACVCVCVYTDINTPIVTKRLLVKRIICVHVRFCEYECTCVGVYVCVCVCVYERERVRESVQIHTNEHTDHGQRLLQTCRANNWCVSLFL